MPAGRGQEAGDEEDVNQRAWILARPGKLGYGHLGDYLGRSLFLFNWHRSLAKCIDHAMVSRRDDSPRTVVAPAFIFEYRAFGVPSTHVRETIRYDAYSRADEVLFGSATRTDVPTVVIVSHLILRVRVSYDIFIQCHPRSSTESIFT